MGLGRLADQPYLISPKTFGAIKCPVSMIYKFSRNLVHRTRHQRIGGGNAYTYADRQVYRCGTVGQRKGSVAEDAAYLFC